MGAAAAAGSCLSLSFRPKVEVEEAKKCKTSKWDRTKGDNYHVMAVFTKNLRKHIFVHPEDQHKLQNAIKIALLKDRKKYSDSLEGALLDVNRVKVIGDRYLIVNGYLSMEVVADFEVFSPTVGMALDAVINKVNRGHYGCLVMNLFNASLSMPDDMYQTAKEGDACSFVVTKIVVDGDLLFMRGQLTSVTPMESDYNLNSVPEPCPTTTDTAIVNGTTLIKMEEDDTTLIKMEVDTTLIKMEDDLVPESDHSLEEKPRKRHKRKLEESILESTEDINTTKSPKKHKKKHKSDKEWIEFPDNSSAQEVNSSDLQATPTDSNIDNHVKSPKKHKQKHKSTHNISESDENVKKEVICPISNITVKSEPLSPVKSSKKKDR